MSARLRLAASYLGFLLVAAALFAVLVWYLLRFVPADTGLDSLSPDRGALIAALLPRAGQVLAVLVVFGVVAGWLLAGRMLRPLRRISDVAREVSAGSFEHRVRLQGRHDEFQQLADAFDRMLDRLQAVMDEQRRFAANASHELRTPQAITRSVLDVAIADPGGQDLVGVLARLDAANRRGTEVVEALLTLSTLERLTDLPREPVDVAVTAQAVLDEVRPLAASAGVTLHGRVGEGDLDGSGVLVRQLVSNLVLNGIRHNTAGGWVELHTDSDADGAVGVRVLNSGPVLPLELLRTMTEPFVRGAGRIAADEGRGAGLGLAIVARIAAVHDADLQLLARSEGGLDVRVRFPPPPAG